MRFPILLLLTLSLAACKKDRDSDGYAEDIDCNDNDDSIHANVPELCDGVDNDCDGRVDEGVTAAWYLDADADGYGDPDGLTNECGQPDGYVGNDLDCNDASERWHPGATEDDCTDPNDYNCDGSVGFTDEDGDGYAACEECDDSDAAISPAAPEVCDGIDNDCNDIIDYPAVDAETWYIDYDHDSYGSDSFTIRQCEQPGGYVHNADDCDDATVLAHPGGTEICDGLDNDCDGSTDGADALDAVIAYTDGDGDGFGDETTLQYVCGEVSGLVEQAGDCDDTVTAVNPDATEVCNDGVDNNCDAVALGCQVDLADDADTLLLGEDPGDYAGKSIGAGGDLDGDGLVDLVVGATSNDAGTAGTEGAAYVMLGPVSAGNIPLTHAFLKLNGVNSGDQAGYLSTIVGDFDDDGLDDLVTTAPTADDGSTNAGSAYLVLGSTVAAATSGDEIDLIDADYYWTGTDSYDWFGGGLSGVGDFDGDLVDDFIVGATGDELGGTSSGSIYVIGGASDWTWSSHDTAATAMAIFTGEKTSQAAGAAIAGALDMNADGYADFAAGTSTSDFNGVSAGAVYLVAGPASGTADLGDAAARLVGTDAGDRAGIGVGTAEDADGDGYDDIWVGASREDEGGADAGAIYLVLGASDLTTYAGGDLDTVATVKVIGGDSGAGIGSVFAGNGDFDQDGSYDLLVGQRTAGLNAEGAVYLFRGPFSGTLVATADMDAVMVGDTTDDHNGSAVLFGGDLYGTASDVIMVAGWEDDGAGVDAGSVFLVSEMGL